jgi:hypothetical protein
MECYYFEKRQYSDGFFNNSVDATYILHLEGNGRLQSINEQLEQYHPTNIVYILFNQGYKKCKKENIDQSSKDLVDACLTIFKDANEKKYNNILILEDDFFFSPEVKKHSNNINDFLNKNKMIDMQYLIGCVSLLRAPYLYDTNHSIIFLSGGMHSVVFTKSNREKILSEPKEKLFEMDWDVYSSFYNTCYGYHIPLCYQIFPDTENKKKWGDQHPITRILAILCRYIIDCIGLDKHAEPSYSYFYTISLVLFYILLFIFGAIIIYVARFILYFKTKKTMSRIYKKQK